MIINIRGTNGSGKSPVVREVMARAGSVRPIYGVLGTKSPESYRLRISRVVRDVVVLGPYVSDTGGCDQLGTHERLISLFDKYHPRAHIICEGVWLSDTWGRIGEYFDRCAPDVVLLFLDTPLDECLRRLDARRSAAGTTRALSATKTSRRAQYVLNVRRRVEDAGRIRTLHGPSEAAAHQIMELLREAR